jgi:arginase
MTGGWTIVGAPFDSSATGRGEERAPAALRAAGIVAAIGARDDGDVGGLLRPARRDAATGVIAVDSLREASRALAVAVAAVRRARRRPLVLGGDCSLLPGAIAGCRHAGEAPGLWMLDGHPDMLDGTSSPTGEAADMDLAAILGHGPAGLADLAGPPPLVQPERVVALGLRPRGLDPENDAELDALPATVAWFDAEAIRASGPARVGADAERRLAGRPAWLHLDLDVLDAAVMPAVTYPQAGGLDWDELARLLAPLCRSPALIGLSVADLEPDRDPEGAATRRTVALLTDLLGGGEASGRVVRRPA